MTYSIISDNSTVYKKYYIIVSFWGKTHLRGFYFYLLKPDKVQSTSSTSRYYLHFQDYSMVKKNYYREKQDRTVNFISLYAKPSFHCQVQWWRRRHGLQNWCHFLPKESMADLPRDQQFPLRLSFVFRVNGTQMYTPRANGSARQAVLFQLYH